MALACVRIPLAASLLAQALQLDSWNPFLWLLIGWLGDSTYFLVSSLEENHSLGKIQNVGTCLGPERREAVRTRLNVYLVDLYMTRPVTTQP